MNLRSIFAVMGLFTVLDYPIVVLHGGLRLVGEYFAVSYVACLDPIVCYTDTGINGA